MRVEMTESGPQVVGLPETDSVLFFAQYAEDRYCVVYGPTEKCLPKSGNVELFEASVAIGELDNEMDINRVRHGHKYSKGGGFVEFGARDPLEREDIAFNENGGYFNKRKVREVYTTT